MAARLTLLFAIAVVLSGVIGGVGGLRFDEGNAEQRFKKLREVELVQFVAVFGLFFGVQVEQVSRQAPRQISPTADTATDTSWTSPQRRLRHKRSLHQLQVLWVAHGVVLFLVVLVVDAHTTAATAVAVVLPWNSGGGGGRRVQGGRFSMRCKGGSVFFFGGANCCCVNGLGGGEDDPRLRAGQQAGVSHECHELAQRHGVVFGLQLLFQLVRFPLQVRGSPQSLLHPLLAHPHRHTAPPPPVMRLLFAPHRHATAPPITNRRTAAPPPLMVVGAVLTRLLRLCG
mmetsp:Transcript_82090/g.164029  ORF Transcript_82090/g.164029 Transcript_82090/m.164029 type:complete len:285 (+) Transcript_82090:411-1265(+)